MPWSGDLCQSLLEWKVRPFCNQSQRVEIETKKIVFRCRKNGEEMRDEKRTLECLKKGARIASQCLDTGVQVQLYVELLNHYLFYFERGNSLITITMLNQLIAKINEELPNLEQCEETKQIEMHNNNTLAHIKLRMESMSNETGLEVSFAGIVLN